MINMSDLIGFVYGSDKILNGLGLKLMFKRNCYHRALIRVNDGNGGSAVQDGIMEIRDISWNVSGNIVSYTPRGGGEVPHVLR